MNNTVNYEDLSFEEKKDIFIQYTSANYNYQEIYNLIATFTAYNLSGELYGKYFEGDTTDEIIEKLNDYLMSNNGAGWDEEDIVWRCAINTLNHNIFDIVDNFPKYMDEYLKIISQLDEIKEILFKPYVKLFEHVELD